MKLLRFGPVDQEKPGVPQQVGTFFGIGLNYADHAAEAGMAVPPEPVVFTKWTRSICGPIGPWLVTADEVPNP